MKMEMLRFFKRHYMKAQSLTVSTVWLYCIGIQVYTSGFLKCVISCILQTDVDTTFDNSDAFDTTETSATLWCPNFRGQLTCKCSIWDHNKCSEYGGVPISAQGPDQRGSTV